VGALRQAGHEADGAADVANGWCLVRGQVYDLVVVDSVLADGTGSQFCISLRRDRYAAETLIMVLGYGNELERIVALECGADDVVSRPYGVRELLLRVRALLRRARQRVSCDVVEVGAARVDRGSRRVTHLGRAVALTRREFDLLVRLIDGRGRVLTREALLQTVWPLGTASDRAVDTTVKRLRRKLPSVGRQIRTLRGVGYTLTDDDNAFFSRT
jgi:two-component system phosphate regulon response regulator PhoB